MSGTRTKTESISASMEYPLMKPRPFSTMRKRWLLMTRSIQKRRSGSSYLALAVKPICLSFVIVIVSPKVSSALFRRGGQPKQKPDFMEIEVMNLRSEYDFSNARKNPYAKSLKRQITINIDGSTIDYFKEQSIEVGIPYQVLINLYLRDCATNSRKLDLSWK